MQENWTLIIKPSHQLWSVDFKEIWRYRDLITLFVKRNIVVQYKQTVLGPLWYLIQPILTVIMNMVVFGGIAKMSTDGIPQPLFYMAGNICWFYFSDCLNQTSNTFIANAGMFGKVYFPRLIVPISTVLSNLLRFGIQLMLFLALYLYYFCRGVDIMPSALVSLADVPVTINVIVNVVFVFVFVFVMVAMLAGLGLGFGILISSMTTKYRDLTILFTFVVQLWMYATPIVYPMSMVTNSTLRMFILANPLTSIIESFRFIMFGEGYFSWCALAYSFIFMCVLVLIGILIFNKVQKTFMDSV